MVTGNKLGKHVKYVLYGVDFEFLVDVKLVINVLAEVIEAAGMRPLGPPHVYSIREELRLQGLEPDPDEPEGVSGIQVLSTSHVAVDTWPHRGKAVVDVFSCRNFDETRVGLVLVRLFRPQGIRLTDVSHSLELPEEATR